MKKPDKKKMMILGIVIAAVIAIIAVAAAVRHNNEVNYYIDRVVSELKDCAGGYKLSFPEADDYVLGTDGYYEEVKNNKKLAKAIVAVIEAYCSDAEEGEPSEEAFKPSGIDMVYRMAAVLEYLDYENADVKACVNGLAERALTAVREEGNWNGTLTVYRALLRYQGLPYYRNDEPLLTGDEVTSFYAARWQEVKREMRGGNGDLEDFLSDVLKMAYIQTVDIPERVVGEAGVGSGATAVNGVAIYKPTLDMEKIVPYDELVSALEQYGETAVFRNGQGGYYDGKENEGTTLGDFRSIYKSGRVPRTGEEDAFTEQYLRDHYDKPSTTTYYFRGEKISAFPPFFTDTTQVFVYDSAAYAFTDYGVYVGDSVLIYDYDAAKEAEWKHTTLSEAELQASQIVYELKPYFQAIPQFKPRLEYDAENRLATVYLTALPGTTEALKAGTEVPITAGAGRTATWDDFRAYLADMCTEMYEKVEWEMSEPTGVSMILVSDVNSESGLLSILNGEVVQDNSQNPPAPSETEESAPDETPSPDESPTPTEAP